MHIRKVREVVTRIAYRPLIHNHIGKQPIGTMRPYHKNTISSSLARVGYEVYAKTDDIWMDLTIWSERMRMDPHFDASVILCRILDPFNCWRYPLYENASARNRSTIHKSCSLHLTQGWGIWLRYKTELYVDIYLGRVNLVGPPGVKVCAVPYSYISNQVIARIRDAICELYYEA